MNSFKRCVDYGGRAMTAALSGQMLVSAFCDFLWGAGWGWRGCVVRICHLTSICFVTRQIQVEKRRKRLKADLLATLKVRRPLPIFKALICAGPASAGHLLVVAFCWLARCMPI